VHIIAIQEEKWTGNGTAEDNIIFYSCQKKEHISETGFIENKKIKRLVIDFNAKSLRLCRLQ
jgi:hypothetical protein